MINLSTYSLDGKGFGLTAYEKARAAGLTDQQIRSSLATSGLKIGEQAADRLNVNPIQTSAGLPSDVKGGFDGFKTRGVLLPKGVFLDGRGQVSSSGGSGVVYATGGSSDAAIANTYSKQNMSEDSWGTYRDPNWDKYVGNGVYDNNRPSTLPGAQRNENYLSTSSALRINPAPQQAPPQESLASSNTPAITPTIQNRAFTRKKAQTSVNSTQSFLGNGLNIGI